MIFTVPYIQTGKGLDSLGFTSNVGDTRSPSVKCLLGLFQKLCKGDNSGDEHPRYVLKVVAREDDVEVGYGGVEEVAVMTTWHSTKR